MRIRLGALALVGLASPAVAEAPVVAKMILLHGQGIAITDYPSMARCEAARSAIKRNFADRNEGIPPPTVMPGGGTLYTLPTPPPQTFCIPG